MISVFLFWEYHTSHTTLDRTEYPVTSGPMGCSLFLIIKKIDNNLLIGTYECMVTSPSSEIQVGSDSMGSARGGLQ
jgi:hypothetical protein